MTPWATSYLARDGRLTVIEVAAPDRAWAERVRAERPGIRLHALGDIPALDTVRAELGLGHVNYLRIADAEAALPVLLGARGLLSHARIDIIEIAGGVTAERMTPVISLLERFDFMLLPPSAKLNDLLLTPFDENPAGVLLFGLHKRFASAITGQREPDLGALIAAHRLTPRGIIHVGAHAGQEASGYLALGFERVLLIEADPTLATGLSERFRDEPRVAVAACAITDHDGTVDLHRMSSSGSSSILTIKAHAEIFPEITETALVRVPARTLDSLLAERRCADDAFNIMTLDIQGAELLALRGAARLLPCLDGLLVEVNFAELYEGCAEIEDIDDHLGGHGFGRVMTMSPYRGAYADAFYVKAPAAT